MFLKKVRGGHSPRVNFVHSALLVPWGPTNNNLGPQETYDMGRKMTLPRRSRICPSEILCKRSSFTSWKRVKSLPSIQPSNMCYISQDSDAQNSTYSAKSGIALDWTPEIWPAMFLNICAGCEHAPLLPRTFLRYTQLDMPRR